MTAEPSFLLAVPPPCVRDCGVCDACLIKLAGQSIRRMLFGRWLVQTGRVTDDAPDDEREMPARLHAAWDGEPT